MPCHLWVFEYPVHLHMHSTSFKTCACFPSGDPILLCHGAQQDLAHLLCRLLRCAGVGSQVSERLLVHGWIYAGRHGHRDLRHLPA